MKRFTRALIAFVLTIVCVRAANAQQANIQLPYAAAQTVDFCLEDPAGTGFATGPSFASGDCQVIIDEGTPANCDDDPSAIGQCWALNLTQAETTGKRIVVQIIDQTPVKVWNDYALVIYTIGNASAAIPPQPVSVVDVTAAGAADFFTVDSGETAAGAVNGSVVGELYQNITNAITSASLTIPQVPLSAGSSTTVTLASPFFSNNDALKGGFIFISDGAGQGQERRITAYNGGTGVITVSPAFDITPDNTWAATIKLDAYQGLIPNAVDSTSMAANAIGASQIATGAITNAKFAAGAIDAAAIAANAITTSEFADGTITAAKIATDAITASQIAANAIGSSEIADGAITGPKLAASALADFFTTDSGVDFGDAVAGSVVFEIVSNSGGGSTPADIADAVWDSLRADHTDAGTFGQGAASVQGNVTGSVASVVGAVGSVTGNVGGNVTGSVGSVLGAVGSVTGAVGSVTGNVGGNVVGSVASVTGNVGGNLVGSVGDATATFLSKFFLTNSGTTYASSVAGSVVQEIADNAGGGGGGGFTCSDYFACAYPATPTPGTIGEGMKFAPIRQ